jgi:hypothetical protein
MNRRAELPHRCPFDVVPGRVGNDNDGNLMLPGQHQWDIDAVASEDPGEFHTVGISTSNCAPTSTGPVASSNGWMAIITSYVLSTGHQQRETPQCRTSRACSRWSLAVVTDH